MKNLSKNMILALAIMLLSSAFGASVMAQRVSNVQKTLQERKDIRKAIEKARVVDVNLETDRYYSANRDTLFIDTTLVISSIVPDRLTHEIYLDGTYNSRSGKPGIEIGYGQEWLFKNSKNFGVYGTLGLSYEVGALDGFPDENGFVEELQFDQLGFNISGGLMYSAKGFNLRLGGEVGWDHIQDARYMRSNCVYDVRWCFKIAPRLTAQVKLFDLGKTSSLWLEGKVAYDVCQYKVVKKGLAEGGEIPQDWKPGSTGKGTNALTCNLGIAIKF